MKRNILKLFVILFLSPIIASSQDMANNGMKFEHLPSMQSLFAKAKKENKLLFVDCYTTWCGPCKLMASKVFNQKEVGDFYNAHYVNAKIQLDSTEEDNEYVKNWLKEGKTIAKKYEVNAYPTYLVFNGDGEIVHRFVGFIPPSEFIEIGKNILIPDSQYYSKIKKYEAGEKSPEFILSLISLAKSTYDQTFANKLTKAYLEQQKDLYTKENLQMLYDVVNASTDYGFDLALNEGKKIDKILGEPGKSIRLASDIILREKIESLINDNDVNFDAYDAKLKTKYPKHAEMLSNFVKYFYYNKTQKWDLFVESVDKLVKGRENPLSTAEINEAVWAVFRNVSDPKLLEKGLSWSKYLFKKDAKNLNYQFAYVNMLNKAGKKTEAIAQTKKSIELAQGNEFEKTRLKNFLKEINTQSGE